MATGDPDKNPGAEFSFQLGKIYDDFFTINQNLEKKEKEAGTVPPESIPKPISLEEALARLDSLIGLSTVKKQIGSLTNVLKIEKLRREQGLPVPEKSLHMVFSGNPGTGKTSVARVLAEIFRSLGVLQKGHLVEVDRAGLVAGFVGQTAGKTLDVCKKAIDGILFIDEAYSLGGGENDFGKEAIQTLLKFMEDNRNRILVIVAGYTQNMKDFLATNPGLESRFNTFVEFPDYSPPELLQIFEKVSGDSNIVLHPDAKIKALNLIESKYNSRNETFGNARFIRNLFEKAYVHQADRLSKQQDVNKDSLCTLLAEDIPEEFNR